MRGNAQVCRHSLLNVSKIAVAIPYGQRFINIDLASRAELVDMVPRGDSTWASPAGTITEASGGTLVSIELYINNILKRINMIR